MGRLEQALVASAGGEQSRVDAEVERMNAAPDDVPADVWALIQENGRVATERLNELLTSPKFTRLRATDQARLIALAQNRAYGTPKANKAADNRVTRGGDVTAAELNGLVHRATLPEYSRVKSKDVEDAKVEYD